MEYWGIPVFLKSMSLFYSLEDVPHYFIIRLDMPVHNFWESTSASALRLVELVTGVVDA